MFSDLSEKWRKEQNLLEEGACEEMMEHFMLMRRIVQYSGKHICEKL